MIGPPAAPRRIGGQEAPQPVPFLIRQIMAIQAIKHPTDLHASPIRIHGTRPSGELADGSLAGGTRWTSAALALKPPPRMVAMILRFRE